jgi:hypothetical protein
MLPKIVALLFCFPLMGFSFLTEFNAEFDNSARIIISSEDLVGSQLTIGEKSTEVSFQDLAKHKSTSLDILIIRVGAGSYLVSLSKFDQILFKTRVILDTGQTRKLRVRQ